MSGSSLLPALALSVAFHGAAAGAAYSGGWFGPVSGNVERHILVASLERESEQIEIPGPKSEEPLGLPVPPVAAQIPAPKPARQRIKPPLARTRQAEGECTVCSSTAGRTAFEAAEEAAGGSAVQAGADEGYKAGGGTGAEKFFAPYTAVLSSWLERYKTYPPSARKLGLEGRVVAKLKINRHGELLSYSLEEPCAHEVLNSAVRKMIEKAAPFPTLPVMPDSLEAAVPVRFELK